MKGWRGALLWLAVQWSSSMGGDRSAAAALAVIGLVSDVNWMDALCAQGTDCVFRAKESKERGGMFLLYGVCFAWFLTLTQQQQHISACAIT